MNTDYTGYGVIDFVMDNEFLHIAKSEDMCAFQRLIHSLADLPEQREAAKEAFLLLSSLSAEQDQVPEQLIETELRKITGN